MADFNGDGNLDMAVLSVLDGIGTGRLTIYLGDGHAGFTAAPGGPIGTGNNPWSIAVADFNRDGKLDIAICNDGAANNQPDSITVLLGEGHGGFAPAPGSPIALPSNTGPLSLAVADFNRDGKPDFVSANLHNRTVSVFLGNGDGTFTLAAGSPVPVPIEVFSVAVADLNGDGKSDVTVGSYYGGVAVLLGDGNGRLTSAVGSPISAGPWPMRVAIGDFNGDGKPDLVIANLDVATEWPSFGDVTILLGIGDGTFRPSNNGSFRIEGQVSTVVVADFNLDGKLDIAAVTQYDARAMVLLGDGTGIFAPSPGSPFTVSAFSSQAAVGDIDGDGSPDLVASGGTLSLNHSKSAGLSALVSHSGNFTQGEFGTYSITVSNQRGAGPTWGSTVITEALPNGLTLVSMAGVGWNCVGAWCGRDDTLLNGLTFPPITVTVRVALGAPAQVTNVVNLWSPGVLTPAVSDVTVINGVPQVISFGPLPSRIYGAAPFALNATSATVANLPPPATPATGLTVTFLSTTPSVCTVFGATVTLAAAGTCSIAADQSGNSIYASAPTVIRTFAVTKAPLIVTANAQTITYGAAPAFTVSFSGLLRGDTSAVVSGTAGFTTNATTTHGNLNAGSWIITPATGTLSASNYSFSFDTGVITVTKALLTVTAANASKIYGAVMPALTSTITGFVNGDSAAVVSGAAGLTCTATASSAVGLYPITTAAGTLSTANYTFAFANGTLTVAKAGTLTSLTTQPGKLLATVTAVAPATGSPTGTVQFMKDGAVLGTSPLVASTATFPSSTGFFTAIYSADGNFTGSTSNPVAIYDPHATSLSLSSSVTPSTLGQPVTFTAILETTGGPPQSSAPTGTVQFMDGIKVLGSGSIFRGQAIFTTSQLTGGWHNIVATYNGDSIWPTASATYGQTVIAAVTMTLIATPASPVYGQPILFTATVAAATIPPGFEAPTGTVTFSLNGARLAAPSTPLGTATLEAGRAAFTMNTPAVGTQTITAQYSGDTTWSANARGATVTVSPASTGAVVSLTSVSGQLLLAAEVAPMAPGTGTPTGTVQFVDTSTNTVVATGILAGGKASATVASGAAASVVGRPIAASYSGDVNYSPSTSAQLPAILNAASNLGVSLAADEIASIFGLTGLRGDTPATAPLPTSLGGVTVNTTDSAGTSRMAPLYGVFASAGQINFMVPSGSAQGLANVTIALPGRTLATVMQVAATAPGIFTAGATGEGPYAGQHLYVHPDGSQTVANSSFVNQAGNTFLPNPINVGSPGDQVYLVLYGTGIRRANSLTASLNGITLPVIYWGAQGAYSGLDQINLGPLPASLAGTGLVNLIIIVDGQPANTVVARIQ